MFSWLVRLNWQVLGGIVPLMFRLSAVWCVGVRSLWRLAKGSLFPGRPAAKCFGTFLMMAGFTVAVAAPANAGVLWSDLGATLAHETGAGSDILGGALRRDDTANDTLYFKFHLEPLSDSGTEEYFAAFQLYEGDMERLGVGNSLKAWGYSAFNTATNGEFNKVFGDMDLRSAHSRNRPVRACSCPTSFPGAALSEPLYSRCSILPGERTLLPSG